MNDNGNNQHRKLPGEENTPQGAPRAGTPEQPHRRRLPGFAAGKPAAGKPAAGNAGTGKDPIDWKSETGHAAKLAGKVTVRVLGYLLNALITILLIGLITGMIVGTAFLIYIRNYVDPTVDLSLFSINKDQTTTIYYTEYTDRENRIGTDVELENQRLYGSENSLWASYGDLPKNLIYAFVCTEDKRFFEHHGVDWLRTGAAVRDFILPSDGVYGGSTITQQLIKNITGDDQVTIQRKVQEIMRALRLEEQKSKEEILEMYLNVIYLSQNCYGVRAAANTYFDKDVSDLSLVECAALAAIVQSPSAYDPYNHPENNAKRRNEAVLMLMYDQGKISQEEYEQAKNTELVITLNRRSETDVSTNSWFTDALIDDVINDLVDKKGYPRTVASNLIYSGGLKIYSTLDPEVQTILEDEYAKDENFPQTTGIKTESAMLIIDRTTGDIVGMVGGREKVGNRVLNRATQSVRPPGSSIKPVSVYGPALEYGIITCASVYDDVPVNFGDGNDTAWPKNLPERYGGLTTISDAIRRSVNTIAVRVLQDLTIDRSFDFIYNKLNCKSLIEGKTLDSGAFLTDKGVAALALGQLEYGITVRELTSAYSMIANGGIYCESHTYLKVLDSNNEVLLSNEGLGTTVMTTQNAYILTRMMQEVVATGTATAITLDQYVEVAGKTGTTSSDYDRWFVGYTPYYVGGIWLGFDYPKSLTSIAGSSHVKLWDTVMLKLHQKFLDAAANGGEPIRYFDIPSGVVTAEYCTCSGKLPTEACRLDPRGATVATGYFTVSTLPTEPCDCHVKVAVCNATGNILGPDCDQSESNIGYRGLIRVESRSFPVQVSVVDAQFVYRDLPFDIRPGGIGQPFFQSVLDEGEFIGVSPGVETPANQYCMTHFNLNAFQRRVAGLDAETTKVPETTARPPETTRPPVTTRPRETEPVTSDTTIPDTTVPPDDDTTAPDTDYEDE